LSSKTASGSAAIIGVSKGQEEVGGQTGNLEQLAVLLCSLGLQVLRVALAVLALWCPVRHRGCLLLLPVLSCNNACGQKQRRLLWALFRCFWPDCWTPQVNTTRHKCWR
jgi:hypothetical protein